MPRLLSLLLGAALLLPLLLLSAPAAAQPRPLNIVLIPGDAAAPAAQAAVAEIRREPALRGVNARVLPFSTFGERHLQAIEAADVLLVRQMGRDLSEKIAPAAKAAVARGARAFAVGGSYGDSERNAGLAEDRTLRAYSEEGGAQNLANLLRTVLARDFGRATKPAPPQVIPQQGLWHPDSGRLFEDWDSFAAHQRQLHPGRAGRPWIGVVFTRGQVTGGSTDVLAAVNQALVQRGYNVAPVFGYPADGPIERFFIDAQGRGRVAAVAALAMKFGNVPAKTLPILERLDVPFVNAINLHRMSQGEWEASKIGLDHNERHWQISGPEFASLNAPTVVASKEVRRDAATGDEVVVETPIAERIERLAERLHRLALLRETRNDQKKVVIVYYNYPPGRENIGASYLNVMPGSLWQMLTRLEAEGYDTRGRPADEAAFFERSTRYGINVVNSRAGALEALVRSGQVVLWPVAAYRRLFDRLPEPLREKMRASWGEPEAADIMVWRDPADPRAAPQFVFPLQRYGKLMFAPQPSRGWEQALKKLYHDVTMPPHHQYLAFYLWLQQVMKVDAMVHVGTHATHEWLSGKEVGFTLADPSEQMVGAVPQFYPYNVDVIGEGLQAKRRGLATIITHRTPAFDRATLQPEFTAIKGAIDDWGVAVQKSESLAEGLRADIDARARKLGLLKDIGLSAITSKDDIDTLDGYLKEIGERQTPFGLPTFGVPATEAMRRSTAGASVERIDGLSGESRAAAVHDLMDKLLRSAQAELDALVAGLAGRFITAGPGGDPLRVPAALPTGKNFYGFDPSRIPTPLTYAKGAQLAEALVANHRTRHGGAAPKRLLFTLWSNETTRHEGVFEAEILALLGVKPKWDGFGRVAGIEVVPREKLGRPRVDVTVVPSGLYRDAFPTVMALIDSAVNAVKDLDERDNTVRQNVMATRAELEAQGVAPEQAARIAAVRLFAVPSGAYGPGMEAKIVSGSNTWSNESEVADVFFTRVGHLFGQGFWGEQPGGAAAAVGVLKGALKGVQAVVHSRSSNLYGTLDNDDVFQYLGGAVLAARQVNGTSPEALLLNLANPRQQGHETLDKYMGREMRSRYLNPAWIEKMLAEGYAGARFVRQMTDNLWGFQVTVPEAVDGTKWQQLFETYVQDKHALNIEQRFREAKNLGALQAIVDRMLSAVNKGYWKADAAVVAELERTNRKLIAEAGVACTVNNCSSEDVIRLAQAQDQQAAGAARAAGFGLTAPARAAPARVPRPIPAAPAAVDPSPQPPPPPPPPVRGQELRELPKTPPVVQQLLWTYAALMALVVLAGVAWQAWQTRRSTFFTPTP